MRIGSFEIALSAVTPWNPRPDWCASRAASLQRLDQVAALVHRFGPADSWLTLLIPTDRTDPVAQAARAGMQRLREGLQQPELLRVAAMELAGLGAGLTPAGDDFLAGAMLALWHGHAAPEPLCEIIATTAAPRTTQLAAAILRRAAAGECSAAWHHLLSALTNTGGPERKRVELEAAVRGVLAYGHSSGGDTLAGFLWMCRALLEAKAAL